MCYPALHAGVGLVSPAYSVPDRLLGLPQKSAKPFPCRAYEKGAHNSFVCRTYKDKALKGLHLPQIGKNPPPTPKSVKQELL